MGTPAHRRGTRVTASLPFVLPHICSRERRVEAVRLSEADREEPETLCSEWHGDGTAGEDDRASSLAATVPARPVRESSGGAR